MKRKSIILLSLGWLLAASSSAAVKPEDYPALSAEELGQLVRFHHLTAKPGCDLSEMEGLDQWAMTAYRYQLAFMAYGTALAQYHYLPAWREAGQEIIGRSIEKELCKPVWEYWATVSQNKAIVKLAEARAPVKDPEQHDPVARENIMYSGHIAHMVGLYEMLYRDFRYDAPGSISFRWSPDEVYAYDHTSLTAGLYRQMAEGKFPAIACEPGMIFSQCNQHPVLAFKLHDGLHGTDFFSVGPRFFAFMQEKQLIDPQSRLTARFYWAEKDLTWGYVNYPTPTIVGGIYTFATKAGGLPRQSPAADGWTGSFLHAWMPDYAARNYEAQKKAEIIKLPDGTINVHQDLDPMIPHGFFATLAAEMGDRETAEGIIRYADQNFHPAWQDGGLYYPRKSEENIENITGVLIALARFNVKDGLYLLHQEPWSEAHFSQPTLTGVDFPTVLVSQAVYVAPEKTLVLSLSPGHGRKSVVTRFKVVNLEAGKPWLIQGEGWTVKVPAKGPVQLAGPVKSISRQGDSLTIELELSGEQSLLISEG